MSFSISITSGNGISNKSWEFCDKSTCYTEIGLGKYGAEFIGKLLRSSIINNLMFLVFCESIDSQVIPSNDAVKKML